ncbi:MAG: nickel pincer cofactor biosynthesis protein LarC [Planctomycetota bacterium]
MPDPRPRLAYLDLIGGAAGDMLLGALVHAGAPLEPLVALVEGLGLGARLEVRREERQAIACRKVEVIAPDQDHHRHLSDVLAILGRAPVSPRVAAQAEAAFRALAAAEAEVHDTTVDHVHFHEVGAVDAIVDVLCALAALEALGVERVESSPLPLAGGTVGAAHGTLPLPAPAVLLLARAHGVPVVGRPGQGELVTPTAAALIATLAERYGPYPALELEVIGYGAGTRRNPPGQPPNLTRVVIGRAPAPPTAGEVTVLEAHVDDQAPEQTAWLVERLREAGALDVYVTPIQAKKGRPAWLVTTLALPERAGPLEDVLLRESSSLGLRSRRETRRVLPREELTVETPYGPIRVKRAARPGGLVTVAPEYEDCARAARERGATLGEVYRAAEQAAGRAAEP